jgi:hypothetical protein
MFAPFSSRFGLILIEWDESVVCGLKRFGRIASNPCRRISERTRCRPIRFPCFFNSAAIRREPYRLRFSQKHSFIRRAVSLSSGPLPILFRQA